MRKAGGGGDTLLGVILLLLVAVVGTIPFGFLAFTAGLSFR